MSPDQKFCTLCGAPNPRDRVFCTNCGARFGAGLPPLPIVPAAGPALPPAIAPVKKLSSPMTLPALLQIILDGMILNIRGMAKSLIKGMIIAFALVLLLHTFLQVTGLRQEELIQMIIAASGLGSLPNAMLFWFLFTAILAFFWSQVTGRGVRGTFDKCTSIPRWIRSSAVTAGITAFPLVMAGIAAALVTRFLLLSTATDVQFIILMFSILFSQQESLVILALSLGWSDLHRIIRKSGPVIPAPGFPVMGVSGAFCGFLAALFVADSLLLIAGAVVLFVTGLAITWYRRRAAPEGTAMPGGGRL